MKCAPHHHHQHRLDNHHDNRHRLNMLLLCFFLVQMFACLQIFGKCTRMFWMEDIPMLATSIFCFQVYLFTFVGAYSHIGFSHPVVEQIAQPDNCYPSDHQQRKQMYENKIYDE